MNKKFIWISGFILLILALAISSSAQISPQPYDIRGQEVIREGTNATIKVYPHTQNVNNQEQFIEITNRFSRNSVKIGIGFLNSTNIRDVKIYKLTNVQYEQPYVVSVCGSPVRENKTQLKQGSCNYTQRQRTLNFSTYVDITSEIVSKGHRGMEFKTLENQGILYGTFKKYKITFSAPPNKRVKWGILVQPQSLSLSQAISLGNYEWLDPWADTSFQYKRNITNTTSNFNDAFLINGTAGLYGIQYWGNVKGVNLPAMYYNNGTSAKLYNETGQNALPYEINAERGVNYSTNTLYRNGIVLHFENNNSNLITRDSAQNFGNIIMDGKIVNSTPSSIILQNTDMLGRGYKRTTDGGFRGIRIINSTNHGIDINKTFTLFAVFYMPPEVNQAYGKGGEGSKHYITTYGDFGQNSEFDIDIKYADQVKKWLVNLTWSNTSAQGGNAIKLNSSSNVSVGWHSVAIVMNRSNAPDCDISATRCNVNLYFDGVLEDNHTLTTPQGKWRLGMNSREFCILDTCDTGGQGGYGTNLTMTEWRFYNQTALSGSHILKLHSSVFDNNVNNFGELVEATYPLNPSLDAANDSNINWNYSGEYQTTEVTNDFSQDLQNYLDNDTLCPPSQSQCTIPIVVSSQSAGILNLTNLNIQYHILDITPPIIHSINIVPNPADAGELLSIRINATDNINLTKVNITLDNTQLILTYNLTSKLYEGMLNAPSEGYYDLVVTAKDWVNLTDTDTKQLNVTSAIPELTLEENDITIQPLEPYERTNVTIKANIHNYGETNANNFKVELVIDNDPITNNTISVSALSNFTTQFVWNATYGNHVFKIKADRGTIITESNESNNEAQKNFFIQDATPPVIHEIIANSVAQGSALTIKVNTTDNVNISTVIAEFDSISATLTYNPTSKLYENTTITAPTANTYNLRIISEDVNQLVTTETTRLEIYSAQADLVLKREYITISPLPLTDGNDFNISINLHNNGGTSVSYSNTAFLVDGVSNYNLTQSVSAQSEDTGSFIWNAKYGNHILTFKADSRNNVSEFNESNNQINISVFVRDITPPTIHQLIAPDYSYVGGNIEIKVNATDNVNVSHINGTLGPYQLSFSYNSSSKLYEATTTAPYVGNIWLNINATDVSDLISSRRKLIDINSWQTDLVILNKDVLISQNSEYLEANVTIRNIGGTDANNFEVRFFMQSPPQFKTLSVKKASSNKTTFRWNLTEGSYMMEISADSSYIIYESDESNNFYYKNIVIPDFFPPPRPGLIAYPPVWASSVTRVVDISPPNTSDAIDHYEYMIDYGEYTNIGLNLSFVTPEKSDGVHILYVRAIDDDGNIGAIANVSLLIDTNAPYKPFIREWHMGNNWTQHDTPYLSWTDPGDRGSGVIKYEIRNETSAMFNTTNTSVHLPNMNTGTHKIWIRAYDAVLTKNASNNITIYVDKTPPNAPVISSPTHPIEGQNYSNNLPVFNWTTPNDDSGIGGYYYLIDKINNTSPDAFSYWTFNNGVNITGFSSLVSNETNSSSLIGLANGIWYFHIKAQDNAGNLGLNASSYKINISQ